MAHPELKHIAIEMRMQGMSYSQIREKVPVSKSTLSSWLESHPLTTERLRALRDLNPRRIENYRATMKVKRDARIQFQAGRAKKAIAKIIERENFIAGYFLFWGEGAKTRKAEVSLANTDPAMIRFFVKWLVLIGAKKEKIRFSLHLYEDMNIDQELVYWSSVLGYPRSAFYKPYIKKTTLAKITYKNGFGHGTCNARYLSQDLNDYVLMGLQHVRRLYEAK